MRQWMVDPRILCNKHLLGEHYEHHMFVGSIKKGKSVEKYLDDGLLEPKTLYSRHEEIVEEMKRRGYNHKSPLDKIALDHLRVGKIDPKKSLNDLEERCNECSKRIKDKNRRFSDSEK